MNGNGDVDLEQPLLDGSGDPSATAQSVGSNVATGDNKNLALRVGMSMAGIGGGPMESFSNQGADTDEAVTGVHMSLVYVISLAAVGLGAFYMWVYTELVMDIAAAFLLLLAPVLSIQKTKLLVLGDMREQQNELRGHCNDLAHENSLICASIKKLEGQVQQLDEVEGKLSALAEESGTNVEHLQYLVEENARLQKEIVKVLQRDLMQDIISTVIRCDRDHDFTLEDRERKLLLARLRNMKGIEFDEAAYKRCVARDEGDLTVADVVKIVKNLMNDDVPEEENIFRIDVNTMKENFKDRAGETTAPTPAPKEDIEAPKEDTEITAPTETTTPTEDTEIAAPTEDTEIAAPTETTTPTEDTEIAAPTEDTAPAEDAETTEATNGTTPGKKKNRNNRGKRNRKRNKGKKKESTEV